MFEYYVHFNSLYKHTTLHKAACVHCNDGRGYGASTWIGAWHAAKSFDEAYEFAKSLAPERISCCSICLEQSALAHFDGEFAG